MPKVKKTRFNQESWDFVAYWYFVKNSEVYKQKELLIHRTFSINKRGSGNPLLHFSIRQLTQFSSKRIPPIWNRLIFPGFWEYRYGLVVELKMNLSSWNHRVYGFIIPYALFFTEFQRKMQNLKKIDFCNQIQFPILQSPS